MMDQTADLTWKGGVPIATQFDDPYFSLDDGVAETRHVFLGGNDLPARFGGAFDIAELGFGTGLNFLVTWNAWVTAGAHGQLRFTSFEAFPMSPVDMKAALNAFPEIADLAKELLGSWTPGAGPTEIAEGLILDVVIGDARQTLPKWTGRADAWFLDGFSPAKNPALWDPELLLAVGRHTKPHGTAATYSAAGHIRRALADAGFEVERVAGYGRKRHMTRTVRHHAK
ncbi:tRNA U34 5-methylaminomethyl-2-thiouridine-forming methyltransferase MnmC [Cognatiyoonia koreensis]|uniref:tRNA U34 5-methylaminomethyl-2-thiouridine-forming methyltransferase MnmC n=1 Tax=Cognatiyoonia koreensis TaxID=364200 RepID=A0A1I0RD13_9RHOB|nr:tRNA (5-methylaminomethyl-2-thiouridine)(34)-methyltransferase MnmD [Cognatiyoonia koreensis]SEW38681.1 tRNA U34 5-methylaminomethyl-2-thiouridine-forming methyltransferase MnmC [Cognatiyoonia koreensis]